MMKRKHIICGMLWLPALFFASCDERTPDLYDAPEGVYFNNRATGNVLVDSTVVTFVYEPDDMTYMDIPVTVQTIGRQSDSDRPVNIRVYSDNAVLGTDYELITPAVVPARTSVLSYVVRLKKTPGLLTETKSVHLELCPNSYFQTFLTQEPSGNSQRPYTSLLTYRIDFSNYYSTAPAGWRPEYVGAFAERKLRLMWKLFDDVVPRADYNVRGAIPFNKWVYMQRELDKYMTTQDNILRGYEAGEVDVDALVDPQAQGNERRLLDFTPQVVAN